ncbi:carbon starvation protein A [Vibrio maritimus]|uniref:Carbon starvation protein A n=1 Tax=Vibrio maritimus TaxID=990268 RepID=A0A090TH23_9VIBR|nr:carbon starvation protein A [Vibrio maritimus]
MSTKKVYLVQLLNIAGVGPIFGPIMGALYGPAAMLWIVIGCIFAGAVHDYFSGMLSVRNGGASVPTITGRYLGNGAKHFMNIFAIVLLLLVGVVFVSAPAGMITNLVNDQMDMSMSMTTMVVIIFAYYIIATIVPVDKIIGRFYHCSVRCLSSCLLALSQRLHCQASTKSWAALKSVTCLPT